MTDANNEPPGGDTGGASGAAGEGGGGYTVRILRGAAGWDVDIRWPDGTEQVFTLGDNGRQKVVTRRRMETDAHVHNCPTGDPDCV